MNNATSPTLLGTASITSSLTAGYTAVLTHALSNNASHTITAIYSGDANWLASSTATPFVLAPSTIADSVVLTTNLVADPNSGIPTSSPGQSVILVVTVTPLTPPATGTEQNPSGTVTFYSSNGTTPTVLGIASLVAQTPGNSSAASLTLSSMPGGQATIYAIYVGDLYYDSGTSNSLTIDVENFTIFSDPGNPPVGITIPKGGSGSATFTLPDWAASLTRSRLSAQCPRRTT